jgi:hypothetical protein
MNKRNATDLLRQAGRHVVVEDTPQFWSGVALEALVEAMPKLNTAWDAVVVDEGQDLTDDQWMLVEYLSQGKLRWAFWDPEQSFWPDRQVRAELFKTRYRLQNRYRCPEAVHMLAGCYRREHGSVRGAAGNRRSYRDPISPFSARSRIRPLRLPKWQNWQTHGTQNPGIHSIRLAEFDLLAKASKQGDFAHHLYRKRRSFPKRFGRMSFWMTDNCGKRLAGLSLIGTCSTCHRYIKI